MLQRRRNHRRQESVACVGGGSNEASGREELLLPSVVDEVEARDRGDSSTRVARHPGHDRGWPHEGFDIA